MEVENDEYGLDSDVENQGETGDTNMVASLVAQPGLIDNWSAAVPGQGRANSISCHQSSMTVVELVVGQLS